MATFTICVKKDKPRKDGLYAVYVRISHQSRSAYIATGKLVEKSRIGKTGEVKDPIINGALAPRVRRWIDNLNAIEYASWSVQQLAEYVQRGEDDPCFSEFARRHINGIKDELRLRTARNYTLALQSLEQYYGSTKVMFSQITAASLNLWIKSLENTHRAKEMYPVCMRQVFRAALLEYNDVDLGINVIRGNPWAAVKIPKADTARKLAITPEECRAFFAHELAPSKMMEPLEELGRDVAKMVLCLGGINTIDLYDLQRKDYYDNIIRYCRAKTKKARADNAYMEMRVPAEIADLVEKYKSKREDTERLFSFAERYSSADSFCANVNNGIRKVCRAMGMEKEAAYSAYTFRHTWGTVAQNYCGASIDQVAFGLNHSSGHRVTRGYLKLSFAPAWELNEKVVRCIFHPEQAQAEASAAIYNNVDDEEMSFRLSPRYMIRATATHKGRLVAEVQDIGYRNIDEVIGALVEQFPDSIPLWSRVQIKIVNLDTDAVWVGMRQKGKGFD